MNMLLNALNRLGRDGSDASASHGNGKNSAGQDMDVNAPHNDTLTRLEAALAAWNEEVSEGYLNVARSLARVQDHVATQTDQATALEQVCARMEALTQELAQREDELAAATQRIAQLKAQGEQLADEAARARKEAEQQALVNHEQRADLERVRAALASARDQLNAARAFGSKGDELKTLLEAERAQRQNLEEDLQRKQQEIVTAQQRITALQEPQDIVSDEMLQEMAALQSEIELLRRANVSLAGSVRGHEGATLQTIEVMDPDGRKRRMGDILLRLGLVSEGQLDDALREQAAQPHQRIGSILVEKGYAGEEAIAQILAGQLGLPFVRLTSEVVDSDAPGLITGQLAKRRQCVPITTTSDQVIVAMANPQDLLALDDVALASGRRASPVVATGSDVSSAIRRYYGIH
jgi:hypothetical protein